MRISENQFQAYLNAIKTTDNSDYGKGYQRGLRRYYHGESFGSPEEHELWLSLSDDRQELGDGYRDGFAGNPPRGVHGNTGLRNAAKKIKSDATLTIRLPKDKKNAYEKLAQADGKKVIQWILDLCDAEVARRN